MLCHLHTHVQPWFQCRNRRHACLVCHDVHALDIGKKCREEQELFSCSETMTCSIALVTYTKHFVHGVPAEKEKRASAVAQKLEEERKAGESARMAKAEQHRAVQQHHKQAAEEVNYLHNWWCMCK